jgi:enediyne biosynthesis protein E8
MTATVASLSRRRLLQVLAVAVAAAPFADLRPLTARADPALTLDAETATLEAWSDTMVPGEKRSPADRAVAGAAAGPGAVQAGAVDMMRYGPVGLAPAVPALAAALSAEAVRYAAAHALVLDPTVPPFVALPFEHRTALALELLDGGRSDQLAWYGLAGVAMLAFHTAGHLSTADAVRSGHPGLTWLDFPLPDPDGLWRYPEFSYARELATIHPATTASGQPA